MPDLPDTLEDAIEALDYCRDYSVSSTDRIWTVRVGGNQFVATDLLAAIRGALGGKCVDA